MNAVYWVKTRKVELSIVEGRQHFSYYSTAMISSRSPTLLGTVWLLLFYLSRPATAPSNCESSRMDVQLCSDLSAIACPGEPLTFICTTVGSPFLAWSSPHYVSESGSPLFFSASEDIVGTPRSSLNGESIGILTKVNSSAPIILESQLSFNVSDQYSTSQIICINTANGVNATTTFNVDLEGTSAECRPPTTAPIIYSTTSNSTIGQSGIAMGVVVAIAVAVPVAVVAALIVLILIVGALLYNSSKNRKPSRIISET